MSANRGTGPPGSSPPTQGTPPKAPGQPMYMPGMFGQPPFPPPPGFGQPPMMMPPPGYTFPKPPAGGAPPPMPMPPPPAGMMGQPNGAMLNPQQWAQWHAMYAAWQQKMMAGGAPQNAQQYANMLANMQRNQMASNNNPAASAPTSTTANEPKISFALNANPTKPAFAAAPPKQPQKPGDWPPSLRKWVENCLHAYPHAKQEIQARLKDIIGKHKDAKTVWEHQWEAEPIPTLPNITPKTSLAKVVPTTTKTGPNLQPPAFIKVGAKSSPKRKPISFDSDSDEDPAKKANEALRRAKEPIVKSKKSILIIEDDLNSAEELARRENRAKRFVNEDHQASKKSKLGEMARDANAQILYPLSTGLRNPRHAPLVGTCEKLEKNYFRLGQQPPAHTVRPLRVLKKAHEHLKTRWKKREVEYGWICDQYKAMRQDLTVQRIKMEFTCDVYETHARIALENRDLGEFNQCQTQLWHLYRAGIPGSDCEFTAYRLLYFLHTKNRQGIFTLLGQMSDRQRQSPPVVYAMAVRASVASGNYKSFFDLYKEAPLMCGELVDCFVERERVRAARTFCKGYMEVSLAYMASVLGFKSEVEALPFFERYLPQQTGKPPPNKKVKAMPMKKELAQLEKQRSALSSASSSTSSLPSLSDPTSPSFWYKKNKEDPTSPFMVDCKRALSIFTDALRGMSNIDIKGQL